MRKSFKQRAATILLAAALVGGGTVVAAAPAQASVDTNCQTIFVNGRVYGYTFTRYYNVVERLWKWRSSEQIYVYNRQACPWYFG